VPARSLEVASIRAAAIPSAVALPLSDIWDRAADALSAVAFIAER
jgi:hypothetical protein